MFLDVVKIEVHAGRGGDGSASFRREKYVPKGGPDGGDGGHGGSVIIAVNEQLTTLAGFRFKRKFKAEAGGHGHSSTRHGKNGENLVVEVPLGTIIFDEESGRMLADLDLPGAEFPVARGGKGGRGNTRFATAVNRAPGSAELGLPGQSKTLRLELKLMADVGLIGYPNAGKSTLLSVISAAKPKIADFPFTTLTPNLGVVTVPGDERSFVAADIPGLIEGAHEGKGLGSTFLRHIERTRLLLHVVDIASVEGRDPLEDYRTINQELAKFNPQLAQLPQLIVLNKIDLLPDNELVEEFAREVDRQVFAISAVTNKGITPLLRAVADKLDTLPLASPIRQYKEEDAELIELTPEQGIKVSRENEDYVVSGRRVEILAAKTDFSNEEAVRNFVYMAKKIGVFARLAKAGAKPGDTIIIAGREFDYE